MRIGIFINGERGIRVIKSLIKNNKKPECVFLLKSLSLSYQDKLKKLKLKTIFFSKTIEEEIIAVIKNLKIELLIVAGFPIIFKESMINSTRFGMLNLHAGPVPKYRGGSPLNWQIINGEKKIGISFLNLDKNIDSGNIYKIYYFNLSRNENIKHAHVKANDLFAEKIDDVIQRIVLGDKGRRQNKKSLYWHQRSEVDSQIDWHKKAEEILNFIRALTRPYNGAFTFYQNIKIKIFEAELTSLNFCGTVGRFFRHSDLGLIVVCGENAIIIKEYQISGKISKLSNGLFDYKSTNSKNF